MHIKGFRTGFVLVLVFVLVSYWPRPSRRQPPKRSFEKFHFIFSVLVSYYSYWLRPFSYWQGPRAKSLLAKSVSYWLLILAVV